MLNFAANSTTVFGIGKAANTDSTSSVAHKSALPSISSSIVFSKHLASTIQRYNSFTIKAMSTVTTSQDSRPSSSGKKRVLISLSDKKDLAFLGNGLQRLGYTIVSTGGTASALENIGVTVTKVEQLTGFPEMLDGRLKTLHPNILAGILARRDQQHHMEALAKYGIGTFDIVVVNLYPFYEKVTSDVEIEYDDAIEYIDIGGPSMIRATAKNNKDVLVVIDSHDYPALLDYLKDGQNDDRFRKCL